jgi:hypothetical protein
MIAVFDVGGPLAAYSLLRSAGMSAVTALVASGVFPAFGVLFAGLQRHRVDVIGVLVLAGIAAGTVLGLTTHNARLVLMEGSVPTGVIALVGLGSLWAGRPLMYHFALQFIGPGTAKGREFAALWQYPGFRRAFRVITAVWGTALLAEAALRVVIAATASTGTALAVSRVMPYAVTAVMATWTISYGGAQRRKGERLAAAAAARGGGEAARDGRGAARDGRGAARDGRGAARDGRGAARDGRGAGEDGRGSPGDVTGPASGSRG